MRTKLLFLIIFLAVWQVQAQSKTNKQTSEDGSTKITTYHQNGAVSTVKIWDKIKRRGNVKGYNNEGKELFQFYLRTFGGHASVALEYFPNGQVSKVKYSSAPDGGIQFYKSTTTFDEQGNKTGFQETKRPFEPSIELHLPKPKENSKPSKSGVASCATIIQNFYEIQNATGRRIKLKFVPKKNQQAQTKTVTLKLKGSEKIVFDTVVSGEIPITQVVYELNLIGKKMNEKFKIVQLQTIKESDVRFRNYWVILRK